MSHKLRPAQEILQQLRWDPRFDEQEYVLGYQERFEGIRETSLCAYLHESEVPLHRLRYIRWGDQHIWNREQRIDLIENGEHPAPSLPPHANEANQATGPTIFHVSPTPRSALVLIPPQEAWPALQHIRERHDPSYKRWMPHINLLFGFVPSEHFEAAAESLAQVLTSWEPISIQLRQFKTFVHHKSTSIWLQPDTQPFGVIKQLQEAVELLFPSCDEQSTRGAKGYTPHLTVAKVQHNKGPDARQLVQQLSASWETLHFTCHDLCLISRAGDEPFVIQHRVPLGAAQTHVSPGCSPEHTAAQIQPPPTQSVPMEMLPPQREPVDLSLPSQPEETEILRALSSLVETYTELTGEALVFVPQANAQAPCELGLYLYGSRRMGVPRGESDFDLLLLRPSHQPLAQLQEDLFLALKQLDPQATLRAVPGAFVPGWKGRFLGHQLEFTTAAIPPALWGQTLSTCEQSLDTLAEADQRALRGLLEAIRILAFVERHRCAEVFRWLLMRLRHWAHVRQVDAHALGYLGGFSWSVLAAWAAAQMPIRHDEWSGWVLEDFFATWWEWLEEEPIPPIALQEVEGWEAKRNKRDRLPILCPLPPHPNSARNITASTLATLRQECQRALSLLQEGHAPWSGTPPEEEQSAYVIDWEAEADSQEERASWEGWCKGQCISAILVLEDLLGCHIRAFQRAPETSPKKLCFSLRLKAVEGMTLPSREACELARRQLQRRLQQRWQEEKRVPFPFGLHIRT